MTREKQKDAELLKRISLEKIKKNMIQCQQSR
jgi:hypothetical protein